MSASGASRSRLLPLVAVLAIATIALVASMSVAPHGAPIAARTSSVAGSLPGAPAAPPRGAETSSAAARSGPDSGTWNSNFFHDIEVTFGGQTLPSQLEPVPYLNTLPITTTGFWVNVSSLAPLLFANVTIWGTQWPGTSSVGLPITGFSPVDPAVAPMIVNHSSPNLASFYFDTYRFFWPGSLVSFNLTAVGNKTTPSEVKSATNDSVPVSYPGGYTNYATWQFEVDTPWASANFTDDIAIATTPNIFGPSPTEPNADQSFDVTITAIDLGGTVAPIPYAELVYQLDQNGSIASYSEPFGPENHTTMSLLVPLGPYPGSSITFNITAYLPWDGGALDKIASPAYKMAWSSEGGWWFPSQGLLENLGLSASPDVLVGGVSPTNPTAISTDEPVNITIHEPIENVTIASATVDFTYSDEGYNHSGSVAMRAIGLNTSYVVLPGLPAGGMVTFYVIAKDINGNPVSSGNFTYLEVGPTSPPLPAGLGLVYVEVLDLNGGGLLGGFGYSIANATWSTSGTANALGFGTPTLPGTDLGYRVAFGTYAVSVLVYGVERNAEVTVSASSPTPTVLFLAESSAIPETTTSSTNVEVLAAGIGLAGAAIATVPLMRWLEERREKKEQEERRITL